MPPSKATQPADCARASRARAKGGGGRPDAAKVSKRTPGGDRKRVQNRISQQCLREKRAASSRHTDHMMEAMSFAAQTDRSRQYTLLLDAHLKLIKENQAMEEALFRMRKKLLSLSSAAAMAADDPVFEEMMGRKQREPEEPPEPTAESLRSGSRRGRHQPPQNDLNQAVTETAISLDADPIMFAHDGSRPTDQNSDSHNDLGVHVPARESVIMDEFIGMLSPSDTPATQSAWFEPLRYSPQSASSALVATNPEHEPQHGDEHQTLSADSSSLLDTGNLFFSDISSASHQALTALPSPWDISSFPNRQKLSVRSSSAWCQKVVRASIECISRSQRMGILKHLTNEQISQQVAVAAFNLLSTGSGVQQYIYGCNGAPYAESVLYWRLGAAARSTVLEPFRPTPLQQGIGDVPFVDFLNWPEIRDQVILAGDSIDLDTLARDVVMHTVVEMPEQDIAVSVFRQHQSRNSSGGRVMACYLFDPDWVFFEVGRGDPDFVPSAPDPVEEAIARELCRRLKSFAKCYAPSISPRVLESSKVAVTQQMSPLRLYDPKFSIDSIAVQDGLTNAKEWKLSREFSEKYSFLDCSSATARYETKVLPLAV
ncbi:hypothetical protein MCOR02_009320 [Pyricularia oryzae]|nr:hypothetical protein MCOR02_009320 [Pyricularia oryzae]KAI6484585.1 hypothetical protein MCOR13_009966 [Pyricularia oryzae]